MLVASSESPRNQRGKVSPRGTRVTKRPKSSGSTPRCRRDSRMRDFQNPEFRRAMRPYVLAVFGQWELFEAVQTARTGADLTTALSRLERRMRQFANWRVPCLKRVQAKLLKKRLVTVEGCVLGLLIVWLKRSYPAWYQRKFLARQYRSIIATLVRKRDPVEYKEKLYELIAPMVQLKGFKVCPLCLSLFEGRPASKYCGHCSRGGIAKSRRNWKKHSQKTKLEKTRHSEGAL